MKLIQFFTDVKCPCGNKYVIEIQKTTKCETTPPKTSFLAGNIFLPVSSSSSSSIAAVAASLPKAATSINIEKKSDDGVIGFPKTSHSFSSIGEC